MTPETFDKIIDCVAIGTPIWDVLILTENIPPPGVTVRNAYIALCAGGAAANVASGVATLGGKSIFIGKFSNSVLDYEYINKLLAQNVNVIALISERAQIGFCVSLVLRSLLERTFFVYTGAHNAISCSDIEMVSGVIKHSHFLYISGFELTRDDQERAYLKAVNIAHSTGTRVFFDPADPKIISEKPKIVWRFAQNCDILCLNHLELRALTAMSNIEKAIAYLSDINRDMAIIVKMRERGCLICYDRKMIQIPGFRVECVDVTGAGDAFAAAIIYGVCKGYSLKKAAILANWFAAQTIKKVGARSFPEKEKITNFISSLRSTAV